MSYFKNYETQFTDQDAVVAALGQMDLNKKVEICTSARALKGYGRASAEIVLPPKSFGNVYEAGFAKQSNGTYRFIAADDDMHRFDQDKMKREYGVAASIKTAKGRGMVFQKRQDTVDKENKPLVKLFFAANLTNR